MPSCTVCGEETPDRARFCHVCGEPLGEESSERFRRTVTILFSDVVDSTGLGERLSHVLTDYFEGVKPVVERHGGTLAKFIGDAVMAVFGLTELHEDDALRAARTAVEMRETLTHLNEDFEQRYGVVLATRTGISTGLMAGKALAPERSSRNSNLVSPRKHPRNDSVFTTLPVDRWWTERCLRALERWPRRRNGVAAGVRAMPPARIELAHAV